MSICADLRASDRSLVEIDGAVAQGFVDRVTFMTIDPQRVLPNVYRALEIRDEEPACHRVASGEVTHVQEVTATDDGGFQPLATWTGGGDDVEVAGGGALNLRVARRRRRFASRHAAQEDVRKAPGTHSPEERDAADEGGHCRIPGGALLLDTPRIRELRVWTLDDGLDQAFPETHERAQGCRFGILRHDTEPGRAIREAEVAGRTPSERLASFMKLPAEAA